MTAWRSARSAVVGRRHAGHAGEGPQRGPEPQQARGKARGPLVAAAGALLEQGADPILERSELGGQRGEVGRVAPWPACDFEDLAQRGVELAAELAGLARTLGERLEVAQEVREANLTALERDEAVGGVAVGDDRALGLIAQQRDRGLAAAAFIDLKQRRALGRGDRQPLASAGVAPAGLIGPLDRAPIDGGEDLHVGVLHRLAGILEQPLDRGRREFDAQQVLEQPRRVTAAEAIARQGRCCRRHRERERPGGNARGQTGQRLLAATPAAHAPKAVLADGEMHPHVGDLMGDRRPVADQLARGELVPAPTAGRRPVIDRLVGIGDHRATRARMALLAALLAPRALASPAPRHRRRIARGRARGVRRGLPQPPRKLLNLRAQRGDLLGLGDQHRHDRLGTRRRHRLRIRSPHPCKIPCKQAESSL